MTYSSVTNYFLVSLSVADLLVTLVCMPLAAWRAYTTIYNFGQYTCKISAYFQCVAVASSIFTITAMAIDRYLAITRPFGMVYRCFNKTTTVIVIIALWLTSLALFSPILWIYRLQVDVYPTNNENVTVAVCIEDWTNLVISQHSLGIVWFVFMFAVPGVIMLFAYSMMGRTLCAVVPPFDNNESSCTQQWKEEEAKTAIKSKKQAWKKYIQTKLEEDRQTRKNIEKYNLTCEKGHMGKIWKGITERMQNKYSISLNYNKRNEKGKMKKERSHSDKR
ncbi:orexin receptor type 2-like [Anoplophora glabripennis]|uniref:orexin receptor type 2-like n=1 Tax=Anoplophora glabripennis TaxID=217634 RepID=UPI0008753489|nr:orexin receptor type 2-like [Anoplophora glabripennis]